MQRMTEAQPETKSDGKSGLCACAPTALSAHGFMPCLHKKELSMLYSLGLAASGSGSVGDILPVLMVLAAVVLAITIFD
jgi:hypothetical protein